jgi:DNA-binding CsgD family transcriptional regulator
LSGLNAQKEHILGGLHRIFAAYLGGWAELRDGVRLQSTEIGCSDAFERQQLWTRWVSRENVSEDGVATWTREGLLFSEFRTAGDGLSHGLMLQRAAPFSDEERQLVDAFHLGCREIYEAGPERTGEVERLAPRYRPTLELLLRGSSEKEVAAERNLSIHTVHEYVKKIYEHFGVSSRPKLLALWIEKQRPAPRMLSWPFKGAEGGCSTD